MNGYINIRYLDSKVKKIIRDREGYYIMIKEDIAILNIYIHQTTVLQNIWKYMKQKLTGLRGQTDKFMIILGDFTMPFSINRITRQRISGYRITPTTPSNNRIEVTFIKHFPQQQQCPWDICKDRTYLGS